MHLNAKRVQGQAVMVCALRTDISSHAFQAPQSMYSSDGLVDNALACLLRLAAPVTSSLTPKVAPEVRCARTNIAAVRQARCRVCAACGPTAGCRRAPHCGARHGTDASTELAVSCCANVSTERRAAQVHDRADLPDAGLHARWIRHQHRAGQMACHVCAPLMRRSTRTWRAASRASSGASTRTRVSSRS